MNMHTFRHPLAAMLAAGLVLSTALPAHAAMNAYLTLKGQRQGPIQGGVTLTGRTGTIEVFGAEHTVKVPVDLSSGLPTGRRQHGVFTIRKAVDKSSPKLYLAFVNNENLSEFTLRFYAPLATGAEVNHYTVKLTNARITSIKFVQPNTKDPASVKLPEQEEVSFSYEKIQWRWENGAIIADDTWSAPTN